MHYVRVLVCTTRTYLPFLMPAAAGRLASDARNFAFCLCTWLVRGYFCFFASW